MKGKKPPATTREKPQRTTTASTTASPKGKRKARNTANTEQRQVKRQKTRPLTTEDIPAIVKAIVSALPDATNQENEPSNATQGYNADDDDQEDEVASDKFCELVYIILFNVALLHHRACISLEVGGSILAVYSMRKFIYLFPPSNLFPFKELRNYSNPPTPQTCGSNNNIYLIHVVH